MCDSHNHDVHCFWHCNGVVSVQQRYALLSCVPGFPHGYAPTQCDMALVFAPGDKYLYRHLYTVAGIGGILIIAGTTLAGRWALAKLQPNSDKPPKKE